MVTNDKDDPASPSRVDSRPTPDPTVLTTQQLHREITSVREIIETRLSAMDKAIELVRTVADRQPALIDMSVGKLRELHEEKFHSIAIQFAERDTRTEQTSRDSKVAVDAALQAAKEAVGEQNKSSALAIAKSEAATTKQIDAIGALIASGQKAIDDKIDDIKTRLTTIEGNKLGVTENRQNIAEHRQSSDSSWAMIFGIIGMVVGIIGVIVAVAVLFKR